MLLLIAPPIADPIPGNNITTEPIIFPVPATKSPTAELFERFFTIWDSSVFSNYFPNSAAIVIIIDIWIPTKRIRSDIGIRINPTVAAPAENSTTSFSHLETILSKISSLQVNPSKNGHSFTNCSEFFIFQLYDSNFTKNFFYLYKNCINP